MKIVNGTTAKKGNSRHNFSSWGNLNSVQKFSLCFVSCSDKGNCQKLQEEKVDVQMIFSLFVNQLKYHRNEVLEAAKEYGSRF